MRNTIRKLAALLLAAVLSLSVWTPASARAEGKESSFAKEMRALDPASLGIRKLGAGEEEPAEAEPVFYDADEIVRVSVFMSAPSVREAGYSLQQFAANKSAVSYRNTVRRQQASVTAAIEAVLGKPLDVNGSLSLLVNAVSADVRYGDIPKIAAVPGVSRVEIENWFEAPAPVDRETPMTAHTSEYMTGASQAWAAGYTGAGSLIAILDTGLDTGHEFFAENAFNYGISQLTESPDLLTAAEVQALARTAGFNGTGYAHLSEKVPFAYDYADNDSNVNHVGTGSDPLSNHGSHVAGIAAGNRYINDNGTYRLSSEFRGAVGMAPEAQLVIMKVFYSDGGASESVYFRAIEDAIVLGCDAVNLSLGSSVQGFAHATTYQALLNSLADGSAGAGFVMAISAGNSGSMVSYLSHRLYQEDIYMATGGKPGSYLSSLCVASADNTFGTGKPLTFGDRQVFYAERTEDSDGNAYQNPAISTIAGSYSYVFIDAVGTAADYQAVNSTVSLKDKIVIVNRGEINFADKGNNAKAYEPKAVIVANNENGLIYMDMSDFTGTFPMVFISGADADAIRASSAVHTAGAYTYYTGTVQVSNSSVEYVSDRSDAAVSSFSSWGGAGGLLLKPEITAPGGSINSAYGTSKNSDEPNTGTTAYAEYDGTSMAAPHIAGMAAVLAEYLRGTDFSGTEAASFTQRQMLQSLLMSTATPMKNYGQYVSLLQQGAGLAEVSLAAQAKSVLMMDPEDNTLTARTGAAFDGKVKAELGDDPAREGLYSYSFTLYNLTGKDLEFRLRTDLFTQIVDGTYMREETQNFTEGEDYTVGYSWNGSAPEGHDVDRDGDTDGGDVQAILDYLAGNRAEADCDLTAADMDGDGAVTSRDAYLLIGWAPAAQEGYILAANGKARVTVSIALGAELKEYLDEAYPNGAYLEGFTYASCVTADDEGVSYVHEHSVPVYGFYGSWTDATMFDTRSYTDGLYGSSQVNYSGTPVTNYLTLQYDGVSARFAGNPYMVEDSLPADRLAVTSRTVFERIWYNLVRAAGTTGFAVSKLDRPLGQITSVLSGSVTDNYVYALYCEYGVWGNTGVKSYTVNRSAADYGLAEGDVFRLGYYAIPEYYGFLAAEDPTAAGAGALDTAGFRSLLLENGLGRGAFVGFDFTVDDTEPVIGDYSLSGNQLTVTASDNLNLAYVAVLSLDGETVYSEAAPGAGNYSVTFDASDAVANAAGYVAVFAADYAGNEVARALKVNDRTYEERTVYVLTDTLTAGEDYLIVSRNTAGGGYALGHSGSTVAVNEVNVKTGTADTNRQPYISSGDVAGTSVWTAGGTASSATFRNDSYYLKRNSRNGTTLQAGTANQYNTWAWNGTNNRITVSVSGTTYYLRYSNGFSLSSSAASIYLYRKTVIRVEVDPFEVSSIVLTPASLDLYKGNTADLHAKVIPITADDRTVLWSSSNTAVATVNEHGTVTAAAAGSCTIRATAHADSSVYTECPVKVTTVNKTLSGIVWDDQGGVYFSYFNTNALPTWTKRHDTSQDLALMTAFIQNNASNAATLYAGTFDGNDSVLYMVNTGSFRLTSVGTVFVPAFDTAAGPSTYAASYGLFTFAYAPYLLLGSVTDPGGGYYALCDMSTSLGDDVYIAGVAVKSNSGSSVTYYVLDEMGRIWQVSLNTTTFGKPSLVLETGIPTSFLYQSLYYDGTWLYWSHTEGDTCEMILIDPSSGKVYHAGDFGENVWPVGGLYTANTAAPSSVTDPEEPVAMTLHTPDDALFTAAMRERTAAEYAKQKNGQIRTEAGDIGRFANASASPLTAGTSGEAEVTVTITEEPASNNGLVTLTYDPSVLTYVRTDSDLTYVSVKADQTAGTVTIAYASKPETVTELAQAVFTARCGTEPEITVLTAQRNEELALTESSTASVEAPDHSWTFTGFIWTGSDANGYTAAEAQFVCAGNAEHTRNVPAVLTSETAGGQITYTATLEASASPDETLHYETKTVDIPSPNGYKIIVTDYTKGAAAVTGADGTYEPGDVTFTVSCENACIVALESADGAYTRVPCVTADGVHCFTVTVTDADVKVAVVIRGDVNLDGSLSVRDANMISRYLVKTYTLSDFQMFVGEVNDDDRFSVRDANLISRKLVKTGEITW